MKKLLLLVAVLTAAGCSTAEMTAEEFAAEFGEAQEEEYGTTRQALLPIDYEPPGYEEEIPAPPECATNYTAVWVRRYFRWECRANPTTTTLPRAGCVLTDAGTYKCIFGTCNVGRTCIKVVK